MACKISRSQYPPPKADELPLHRAARTGDHTEIRRLVATGERLDFVYNAEPDPESNVRQATPLMVAAGSSDGASEETIRVLVELGAIPTARDNFKLTAMYYANSLPVVNALVKAGLGIEDVDEDGRSPLANAVTGGSDALPRVQALIQAGANVNAVGNGGDTVFLYALGRGRHSEALRLLIASGANPRAISEYGRNAFHAAIIGSKAEASVRDILGYLKELGLDIEHRDAGEKTPLARAIQNGSDCEVRVLCELGADPNVICRQHKYDGYTASQDDVPLLFHAADGPCVHKDIKTEALLRAGANPLVQDAEGYTPFARVVASLCKDVVQQEACSKEFYKGLQEIQRDTPPMPESRDRYLAEITSILREYVERFAFDVSISEYCQFDQEWRTEKLNCIVQLGAYMSWAHHQAARNIPS